MELVKVENTPVVVNVNDIEIEVQPDSEHEWLLSSKDVAEGYGLSEGGLRSAKSKHSDEFEEGKHFIGVANGNTVGNGGSKKTMWTKRGVVRLGFFIKTPMAKAFRDWAEDYIIEGAKPQTPKLPTTYLEALEELVAKEKALLEMKPKVELYNDLTHQNEETYNDMTLSEVAKELGYKPKKEFFPMLREAGVIFKHSTEPKSMYVERGWFRGTPYNSGAFTGMSWKVTPKGMAGMLKKFGRKQEE